MGSFQWLLAPTDSTGANPRPDLRPNVVNNSWGGPSGDPLFQEAVRAWVAAGIFPVFSNGNSGEFGCNTAGSPGDYPESYSTGAFDINDVIAYFSSRGSSALDGGIKPDISAPGVDVRSSVPGNGYTLYSGTSMAAPHVTGTVALMWSAAPSLVGDLAQTRALLDETAVDKSDLQCGGEPENNNVWGEGTLDAFAAVERSPRGPTGTLTGVVTNADTGAPVAGARVSFSGPTDRRTITGADGSYTMRLPVGDYAVEATAFGYDTATASATVTEDATTTVNLALSPVPSHTVSGQVVDDDGSPVSGVTITVVGTPVAPVITGADGRYSIPDVPEGEYEISADAGGCLAPATQTVVVDGDETVDFALDRRADRAGYTCGAIPADYIEADTPIAPWGENLTPVALPFGFQYYGYNNTTAYVSPNGHLSFHSIPFYDANANTAIPNPNIPNAAIYPFWDDLFYDDQASILTRTVGSGRDRAFVIEWRDMVISADPGQRVSFEAVLFERGDIEFHYRGIDGGLDQGGSATVGIENGAGDDGLQYSYAQPVLSDDRGVLFDAPSFAFVSGTVEDSADGSRISGATVRAIAPDGTVAGTWTTDANGIYIFRLRLGTYTIEASLQGEATETATVVLDDENEWLTANFELELAGIDVDPDAIDLIVPAGESRTRTLTVNSTGDAPLEYEVSERSVSDQGGAPATPPAGTAQQPPAGYQPVAAAPSEAGGPVLVVRDVLPWGSDALTQLLQSNGITYDVIGSSQLTSADLSQYQSVIISNDQPTSFYDSFRAALPQVTEYVEGGGLLWMGASTGWNGGNIEGVTMPGGVQIRSLFLDSNDVIDPDHPTVQGVADPFAVSASTTYFDNLPPDAHVIATGSGDPRPTLIEYDLGAGMVLATAQPLEWGYIYGYPIGRILENTVPYVNTFDAEEDLPWLTVTPTTGTIAPGDSATLAVTVNAADLAPGLYRARVVIRSNDPRRAAIQVPVTVLVPAYQRAVDVGATGSYTDADGDTWTTDRQYAAGQWGYTNASSSRLTTTRAIGGTTEDVLYQTARNNPSEYRFDGVPNGVYEIDLRFAEVNGRAPGRRLADVIAEQSLLLPAHDISNEVGTFNADNHTATVVVTDGQLNVRLVPRAGTAVPILNGLRVTHRLDR
jgi:hypothetical protein